MKRSQKDIMPPRLATWLLESFCSYDFLSTAKWDLEELYLENLESKGKTRASLVYYQEVFGIIIHLFFKGKSQYSINTTAMLKHNILISLRSFKRFKSTFIINLVGLASGLACALLIFLWVAEEVSMDTFHENDERLYQIMQNAETATGVMTFPWTPLLVGPTLIERFPEVENATTMYVPDVDEGDSYLGYESNFFISKELWVDKNFFELLNFPILLGNPHQLFDQLNSVMISEGMALKLFGSIENAMGKTVKLQNYDFNKEFVVSGIFKDVPSNSSLQFEALYNLQAYVNAQGEYFPNWTSNNTITYALLNQDADLEAFNKNIHGLTEEYAPNAMSKLFAQPFTERYLHGIYSEGKPVGGRIAYVRLFSAVAIVILIIACINFMNLSTAKANTRLKELGVKKALGAQRKTLIAQYITEALLLTTFASLLGLLLALTCLPLFNNIIGKNLSFELNLNMIFGFVSLILITSFLAGSYPSLYLSRLKTIASLKGKIIGSFGDIWARKGLVIFQFSISIILIVSVFIVSNQIEYIQTKNLGYNRDNVMSFQTNTLGDNEFDNLINELERLPGVMQVGPADHDLTGNRGRTSGVNWPGRQDRIAFLNLEVGLGFIETMGIEILEGRSFSRELKTDIGKVIFNETAIKQMGLKDPIGKTVQVWGNERQIIGIVKDFHIDSFYEQINPTMINVYDGMMSKIFVKVKSGTELQTINQIEEAYEEISEGAPFNFSFVDSDYQAIYEAEKQVASLSKSFAFIAILISCLGLFGLTAFNAERRIKEIGIRKVLGAGIGNIVFLLSSDFSKMILMALVIGLPSSYFIAQEWISSFAFAINLSPVYFILAGMSLLVIAWLTVSFQTIKVANQNPVDSLRME